MACLSVYSGPGSPWLCSKFEQEWSRMDIDLWLKLRSDNSDRATTRNERDAAYSECDTISISHPDITLASHRRMRSSVSIFISRQDPSQTLAKIKSCFVWLSYMSWLLLVDWLTMKLNSEQYAAFGTPTCDIFPTYPVRRETVRIRYRPELTVSDLRQTKAVLWFLWLCVLNVISITTDYEPSIRGTAGRSWQLSIKHGSKIKKRLWLLADTYSSCVIWQALFCIVHTSKSVPCTRISLLPRVWSRRVRAGWSSHITPDNKNMSYWIKLWPLVTCPIVYICTRWFFYRFVSSCKTPRIRLSS